MFHNDYPLHPDSFETCIKNNKLHFAKMYPDMDYDAKYVLWLQFETYFDYLCDSISGTIHLYHENGIDVIALDNLVKTRHIHPNRNWYTICMKNGRKLSDVGVIVPFESFSHLRSIKRIVVYWQIKGFWGDGSCHNICAIYNVSFEHIEGKKVYSIRSCDYPGMTDWAIDHFDGISGVDDHVLPELFKDHDISKKLSEYDKACIFMNDPENSDYFGMKIFKGEELDDDEKEISSFNSPFASSQQAVDVFVANETISPLEYSILAFSPPKY